MSVTTVARRSGGLPEPASGRPGHLVPNSSEWLPGDIIPVKSSGSAEDLAITAGRLMSFNRATREGRDWVGAAIHVGDGEIVEITAGSCVAERLVWPCCQTDALARCRLPSLTSSRRRSLAAFAANLALKERPYRGWELTHPRQLARSWRQITFALQCQLRCEAALLLWRGDGTGSAAGAAASAGTAAR